MPRLERLLQGTVRDISASPGIGSAQDIGPKSAARIDLLQRVKSVVRRDNGKRPFRTLWFGS